MTEPLFGSHIREAYRILTCWWLGHDWEFPLAIGGVIHKCGCSWRIEMIKMTFDENEICALIDALYVLEDTGYEEDDERVEELKWLRALRRRLQWKVDV